MSHAWKIAYHSLTSVKHCGGLERNTLVIWNVRSLYVIMSNTEIILNSAPGGGGGGHSPVTPHLGRYNYVPRQSENWGLRRELELENWDFRNWLCRTRLAGALAANPEALPELKAFGLAEVYKPAVGGDERLERKEILKKMVSGRAKKLKSALPLKMVMLRSGNLGLKMGVSRAPHT